MASLGIGVTTDGHPSASRMQAGSVVCGKPHFFHVQLWKARLLLCLPPKRVCDGKEMKVRKLWDPTGILMGGKKSI